MIRYSHKELTAETRDELAEQLNALADNGFEAVSIEQDKGNFHTYHVFLKKNLEEPK